MDRGSPAELHGECAAVLDQAIRAAARKLRIRNADLEDFAQEVRCAALDRDAVLLRRCRGANRFGYFYRIALGVMVDRLRHRFGRGVDGTREVTLSEGPRAVQDALHDAGGSNVIEHELETTRALARVATALSDALAQLEPSEIALLRERFADGQTLREIGGHAGLTRRQADLRLHHLLRDLQDMLRLAGITEEDVVLALTVGLTTTAVLTERRGEERRGEERRESRGRAESGNHVTRRSIIRSR